MCVCKHVSVCVCGGKGVWLRSLFYGYCLFFKTSEMPRQQLSTHNIVYGKHEYLHEVNFELCYDVI